MPASVAAVAEDMRLYKAICVPLDGFIIVTVVRTWINRKRPYEIFELPSVIPKRYERTFLAEPACVFRGSDCVYVLVCVPGVWGSCYFCLFSRRSSSYCTSTVRLPGLRLRLVVLTLLVVVVESG